MLEHLPKDCLAVICSFLLGSYSYYESSSSTATDSNDQHENSTQLSRNRSFGTTTTSTRLDDLIPLRSLMHTHPQLHDNIYHNELIWTQLAIPFPDFLQSRILFQCLTEELELGDFNILEKLETPCNYENHSSVLITLFHRALLTFCDLNLIRKVMISKVWASHSFLEKVLNLFPNVEELTLSVKYDRTIYRHLLLENIGTRTRQDSIWLVKIFRNLKKIRVCDFDTLKLVSQMMQDLSLENISIFCVTKKQEMIQLLVEHVCHSQHMKNIEILSLISIEQAKNLLPLHDKMTVLKISETNRLHLTSSNVFQEIFTKFEYLQSLSISFPSLSSNSEMKNTIELSGTWNHLEEISLRFATEQFIPILNVKNFKAPKLKSFTTSHCILTVDSSINNVTAQHNNTCYIPCLNKLHFTNVHCMESDYWTSLPNLSTFFATYQKYYSFSIDQNINRYSFQSHKHLKSVMVNGMNWISIENCRALKKISISKTSHVSIQLSNSKLSYLSLDSIESFLQVQVDECETVVLRGMQYHVAGQNFSLNINTIHTLNDTMTNLLQVQQVKNLKLYCQNNQNRQHLRNYLSTWSANLESIQLLVTNKSDSYEKAISKVFSNFTLDELNNKIIPFLSQPISQVEETTREFYNDHEDYLIKTEIVAPQYDLDNLNISIGSASFKLDSCMVKRLNVSHLKYWDDTKASVLQAVEKFDWSLIAKSSDLNISKLHIFQPSQSIVFSNLRALMLTDVSKIELRLNSFPLLSRFVVNRGLKLLLNIESFEFLHLIIFNIVNVKQLSIESLSQLKAPKLRELVIANIDEKLSLGSDMMSKNNLAMMDSNFPSLLFSFVEDWNEMEKTQNARRKVNKQTCVLA
ncbi:hypothetical protein C9374_009755 [Naegleria lovaniensis]|uniref:Uncharacterized protein n=1 Tax=Naegleria lovaniensis TaxID=51637 RepID=A0AA88H252_NAELO|nr:uncharacterized protein C9374_009755 [Naegleria lovaniensis]KAG2393178.1 hypothetical protein C9374_009755 [Naegleria lovaniensis]